MIDWTVENLTWLFAGFVLGVVFSAGIAAYVLTWFLGMLIQMQKASENDGSN